LEEAGGRVGHSETLREQQGDHEVAKDEEGHDEGYGVLCAHSRSTALRTRTVTAKKRPVTARKTRSAMGDLREWTDVGTSTAGKVDTVRSHTRSSASEQVLTGL
jgi:hypothetical protein